MAANSDDQAMTGGPVLIILLGGVVLWTLWHLLGKDLLALAFWFSRHQFALYQHLPLIPASVREEMATLQPLLKYMNPAEHNFAFYAHLWGLCAYGLRLVVFPWMIFMAIQLPRRVKRFKYRRRLSMDLLVRIQSRRVFSVAVIKDLKLHKEHPHKGPWRVAMNPLDFALANKLLLYKGREVIAAPAPDDMLLDIQSRREQMPDARYVVLDRPLADELHKKQLGSLWKGFESLSANPPAYILAASFAARIAGSKEGKKEYEKLMGTVAYSFKTPQWDKKTGALTKPAQFDVEGAMEQAKGLIAKYESNRYVQRVMARHAFVSTMLMGLLAEARARSGKVPPSEFLWLRPVDRRMWYTLHQLGGNTGWCEAHGPWAHYLAESAYGKAIATPIIEGASDALEFHLAKEGWITTDLIDPENVQRKEMLDKRASNRKSSTGSNGGRDGFGSKRGMVDQKKA